jgi:gliding motility-associated-like protein
MRRFFTILTVLVLLVSTNALATHLRAGEITAQRISTTSLTYRITITTYTDEINGKSVNDLQQSVFFFPGFENNGVVRIEVPRSEKVLLSPSTVRNTYVTEVTFPGPGQYRISCGIPRRNDATINLPQPSQAIDWFVHTTMVINSGFGINSTPILLNVPVDSAALGVKFIHNPGAFDVDGDSLSYRLIVPYEDKLTGDGRGGPIEGYRDPTTIGPSPILNEAGNGPATLRVNPVTGDLIWDAPRQIGQYNVAMVIDEWRKAPNGSYVRIGEIVRDMQIIVVETDNKRPELEVPEELCIEAGETLKFDVTATDANVNQPLRITSSGGVYNIDPTGAFRQYVADKAAVFTTASPPVPTPATGQFLWETNCEHIRQQSYDVLFKVEDIPGRFVTQLVDIKTTKINIVPARPKGLSGRDADNGVLLTWQTYNQCSRGGRMLIYRKDGCSGLNPGECIEGMPADWQYQLIGTAELTDSSFVDTQAEKGQIYSYRLIAEINTSAIAVIQSAPSTESCVGSELPRQVPVLTKVSISNTSQSAGSIDIVWTRPIEIDVTEFKGPYFYSLSRTTGLGGSSYTEILRREAFLTASEDTTYTDLNLNTENQIYRYKLTFYYEGDKRLGEAPPATAVRLNGSPDDRRVHLSWEANTPWSNDNQIHYIYRENKEVPGEFNIIAAVETSGPNTYRYTDDGQDRYPNDGNQSIQIENNISYCYKVVTQGIYSNVAVRFGLLNNTSQVICLAAADRSPPCKPVLTLANTPCEQINQEDFCNQNTFTNVLNWNANPGGNCRSDIRRFNIYYSRYPDGNFEIIGSVNGNSTQFTHQKNSFDGFAGCYYITAVSILDVESEPSNIVCADNCESISFPNVFSPNNDGRNDTFEPMNCPAFVKTISYEIYNRQGLLVARGTGQNMSWDGVGTNGNTLPSGTYYYHISVEFNRLEENTDKKTFKGWLELIR